MTNDEVRKSDITSNRKVRVPINGTEVRAMIDAADHLGYGYIDRNRQAQVAKHLRKVIARYVAYDHEARG